MGRRRFGEKQGVFSDNCRLPCTALLFFTTTLLQAAIFCRHHCIGQRALHWTEDDFKLLVLTARMSIF